MSRLFRRSALVFWLAAAAPASTQPTWADDVKDCRSGESAWSDFGHSFDACRRLADEGDPRVEYKVAVMYNYGLGIPLDYGEGSVWLLRSAEQGFAPAETALGDMFRQGKGVDRNYAEAAKWYLKAAEQGDGSAQHSLGAAYAAGRGVPQDDVEGYMWLSLAAAKLEPGANADRDAVAARMTPEQMSTAEEFVREWKPAAPP
jgi:TPR repeat protein